MNPFKQSGHFIAYFIPGGILLVVLSAFISPLLQLQLVTSNSITFLTLAVIFSTALGLILDEIRHLCLDEKWENSWVETENNRRKKNGTPEMSIERNYLAYVPQIGLDLYRQVLEEYFYFYEFDLNIAFTLLISAFLLLGLAIFDPTYIVFYWHIPVWFCVFLGFLSGLLTYVMVKCGRDAHDQFYYAFEEILAFKKSGETL